MSAIAAAIEDLRFGLDFAAQRYRGFAEHIDQGDAARLLRTLADERSGDADALEDAAREAELPAMPATIDPRSAAELLHLGTDEPIDAASTMYRVQRAENELGRMSDQLASLTDAPAVQETLAGIGRRIDHRKGDVREMRRHVRRGYGQVVSGDYGAAFALKPASVDGRTVDIWFATNRDGGVVGGFTGSRAETISYGRCSVFVPSNRRVGSLGSGFVGRMLRGDDRIKLQAIEGLGAPAFWTQIRNEVGSLALSERSGLVFLHGYRTKFDDAARRTAQLKVDLAHAGPAAFFSWPSLGTGIGYTGDEAAIEGSELVIQQFLTDFAERAGADKVHVIAHSMGNRGLLRAMHAIASAAATGAPVRFGQIFLAAPDVDTQLFKNLAAAYGQVADRTTLYVTDNDQAIGLSRRFHGYPRAGLTPPVIVIPGVDTIDASGVNLGMWGHGYAAEMRPVLADMYELMRSRTPPPQRFGLQSVTTAGMIHWKFAR
jgi:esterase/lipase superfamily enzyme